MNDETQRPASDHAERSTRRSRSDRADGTRLKATRNWLTRQTKSPVEHAILGSFDLGYAVRHPIKSSAWVFGFGMSSLMVVSFMIGGFHLLFGKPGTASFAWDRPTTWISSGVDAIREPIGDALGIASDRLGKGATSGREYDPESFE